MYIYLNIYIYIYTLIDKTSFSKNWSNVCQCTTSTGQNKQKQQCSIGLREGFEFHQEMSSAIETYIGPPGLFSLLRKNILAASVAYGDSTKRRLQLYILVKPGKLTS